MQDEVAEGSGETNSNTPLLPTFHTFQRVR